ncbi:MAG: serine/threonine-protein kinase [Pirellulaceae bacterium]|nr:serine/threonine-protein kinase [Pirellulaceae bacterium]
MGCQDQAKEDATQIFNRVPSGYDQTLDGSGLGPANGSSPEAIAQAISKLNSDFGEYELLGEIARGGMGVVFKARHKRLNRLAAIKMIRSGKLSSREDIQRFYIEANAAAQLDHPGIVPIYEIGEHEGQPFFAMKFIEGGSLAQHIEKLRSNKHKLVEFVAKIAEAVHHAHQRGILHRDIKPANIMLDEAENPLLTDLGLAKNTANDSNLTQTGVLVGTPSYMPPEQAESGSSLTTAVDIYSTGAILYELLTGKPPHTGTSPVETILRVLNDPIRPPRSLDKSIEPDLELICMKCLERDPQARYSSAASLAADLRNWLDGEPISVKPPTLFAQIANRMRRNQGLVYAILVALTGSVLSLPLMLSLLTLWSGQDLYAQTEADPLPTLYKLSWIPTWISVGASVITLLTWPMLGLMVVLVTRPKELAQAALNGMVVGSVCGLLFVLAIGWYPISRSSIIASGVDIRALSDGFWKTDPAQRTELEAKLLERYPLLADIPQESRARYISKRIESDCLVTGSLVMVTLLGVGFLIALSIAMGAFIAKLLNDRQHAIWILVPRYLLTWTATVVGGLLVVSALSFNLQFNGKSFYELSLMTQCLILGVPPVLVFLLLRRWRRPKPWASLVTREVS